MPFSTGWYFILGIMFLLSFIIFIQAYLPSQFQIFSIFDIAIFGGNIITIGAACVITTGIPCAIILIANGLFDFFFFIVVPTQFAWFKALFITPIIIVLIFILVKELGRG